MESEFPGFFRRPPPRQAAAILKPGRHLAVRGVLPPEAQDAEDQERPLVQAEPFPLRLAVDNALYAIAFFKSSAWSFKRDFGCRN
jgi:hypothetical protein